MREWREERRVRIRGMREEVWAPETMGRFETRTRRRSRSVEASIDETGETSRVSVIQH
jgi:hypothetical protein